MGKERVFETVVGVVVLIVAALFFHYVYKKSSWNSIDGYTIKAKFERADGLAEGGDVKISGIRVGKIIATEVETDSFLAVVTFLIPHNIKLPKDTAANIASDGLLGGKYLALIPGGDESYLVEGDEIVNTTGAISFESLVSNFLLAGGNDKK